jgi:hypothetical protein
MNKILTILFLFISISVLSQSVKPGDSPLEYVWKYVGSPDFNGTNHFGMNFALGSDGTPYVSYGIQNGYTTYLPAVEKYDGNQWVFVGSHPFGSGSYEYSSLAVSPSGEPYLAFEECSPSCHISCMKYNGSDWVYINSQGDVLGNDGEYINMIFSPTGEPWVVFSNDFDSSKVSVKKYDGTQWNYVGQAGFSEPFADWDCLAFSGSGEAFVAYTYGNITMPPPVEVRKFDGTNWVIVGAPFIPAGAGNVTLAIDTAGQPWVAISDGSVNDELSVLKFNGSQWVYVGSPGLTSMRVNNAIIAFSPTGEPWVSYCGPYSGNHWVSVIRFDGNQWVYVGDSTISPNNSDPVNLVFRSNGEPYVGFFHIGCNVVRYDSLYTDINPRQSLKLLLYPNLTESLLTIDLNAIGTSAKTLKIIDMQGNRMIEKPVTGLVVKIDVSTFLSGIYCVEITSQESCFYGKFCKTQ